MTYHHELDVDLAESERTLFRDKADSALETLQGLFCCQPEFTDNVVAAKTLNKHHADTADLVDMMLDWSEDLIIGRGAEWVNDHWEEYHEVQTTKELRAIIDPATTSDLPVVSQPSGLSSPIQSMQIHKHIGSLNISIWSTCLASRTRIWCVCSSP